MILQHMHVGGWVYDTDAIVETKKIIVVQPIVVRDALLPTKITDSFLTVSKNSGRISRLTFSAFALAIPLFLSRVYSNNIGCVRFTFFFTIWTADKINTPKN